jgi:hypothetical protein
MAVEGGGGVRIQLRFFVLAVLLVMLLLLLLLLLLTKQMEEDRVVLLLTPLISLVQRVTQLISLVTRSGLHLLVPGEGLARRSRVCGDRDWRSRGVILRCTHVATGHVA